MDLLTIGAFAKATGLSAKALRFYDQLGLLRPAAVDSSNGYRYYHPDQLLQARTISRLREIEMPLADIRRVVALAPTAAAAEVAAYWEQVLAETTARGQRAALLIEELSGRSTLMTTLALRYAARTATGPNRSSNEDAVHADGRVLAVADGMRGSNGAAASTAAVTALAGTGQHTDGMLDALAAAVGIAHRAVRDIAADDPEGQAVTTVTALLQADDRIGVAHIGDTRIYLLRDGELRQLTRDHSYVQLLVDAGQLSPAEAENHPKRALLARALTEGAAVQPDLSIHPIQAGDRFLLCSDGLYTALPTAELHSTLRSTAGPDQVADKLMGRADEAGATDNISCIVADIIPA
ncbi:MAG TPA: MerR family transcriptional regulator [Micromonospora sp.]|nr:MerR family transcriptional regulator [Micromonospora sp.]